MIMNENIFFIIQSYSYCENITVSMIKYLLANHKCTALYFIMFIHAILSNLAIR